MRNYHRKYNEEEENLISFEFELRKTVSDHRADECLNERGRKRKEEGIEKSAEIMVLNYEEFPRVRCRVLGDELDRSELQVHNVLRAHERGRYLGEEGEKNDV